MGPTTSCRRWIGYFSASEVVWGNRSARSSRRRNRWRESRLPTSRRCARLRARCDLEREGDFDQSARLYKYATELDPGFAMAYGRLGAALFALERYAEARVALESALTIEGRLSERERAYVQGLFALYADPQEILDSWRMYAALYPDQNTGQHNVGSTYYYFLLDYPNAEAALARAAALHGPLRNFTLHTLGHVLLAQEKVDPAEQQFRAAETLAPSPAMFGLSDALVAGGKLDEAMRYLGETKRQPAYFEVEREMRRATLLIARGEDRCRCRSDCRRPLPKQTSSLRPMRAGGRKMQSLRSDLRRMTSPAPAISRERFLPRRHR